MNKAFDPIDIFFIVVILVYFVCLISFIVIFLQKYYDFDKPNDDSKEKMKKVKAIDKKSIKNFILNKKEELEKTKKTKAKKKTKKTTIKDAKVPTQMKEANKKTNAKKKRPNKTQSKKNVKRNYKSNVSYVRNNPKRKGTSK